MPINSIRYISNDSLRDANSSSFKYIPSNPKELEDKGEMYSLITVIGSDGVGADRIAKFVWDAIVDSYYYLPFSSVIDCLKRSVSEGSKKAQELIKNEKGIDVNLSFAIAVIKGKTVFLTVFGEQELFMFKNGGIVKVSEVINQNRGVVVSVAFSENDIIMLSSPNLLSGITASINIGDSSQEVVKNIEYSSYNLTGYQSILLLSGREYKQGLVPKKSEIKKLSEEKAVINTDKEVKEEKVSSVIKETESEVKESVMVKNNLLKKIVSKIHIPDINNLGNTIKKILSRITPLLKRIIAFVNKFVSKIGEVISLIFGKMRDSFKGLLGNKHWYRRLMSKLPARNTSGGGLRIDGYKEVGLRNKRIGLVLLIALLVALLFFGVKLSIKAKEARQIHKEAIAMIEIVESKLDIVAKDVLVDPENAAVGLYDVEPTIEELSKLKLSVDDNLRYLNLKQKYTEIDDKLNKKVEISEEKGNFQTFIDGRAEFGPNAEVTDITYYKDDYQNGFLLVVEKNEGVVYKINLENKKIDKIPDAKKVLRKPKFVDYGVGGVYVFDEAVGIVKSQFLKGGGFADFSPVSGLDIDVIGDISVDDFAIITSSDNVYLLSKSEKSILKAGKSGSGYSLPYDFITSKTLANAHNLANDISIYALTTGEKGIERYAYNYAKAKTTLVPVTTVDLTPDFGDITAGYTGSLKDSHLFVFDQTNERLVMLEKPIESGEDSRHPNQMVLISQFIYKGGRSDVFKEVKELAAEYFDENVYVLDGNIIYKVMVK